MSVALLLVDLQIDFLSRPGLWPPAWQVVQAAQSLLQAFRQRALPVCHVHTQVKADGSDAMPHWQNSGRAWCRAGSLGAAPPEALQPLPGECVVHKRFFSGFESPELLGHLRAQGVQTVVIAGLYSHACVRETALQAYAHGLKVCIAEDATGSTEPMHAEIGREHLSPRGIHHLATTDIVSDLAHGWCPNPPQDAISQRVEDAIDQALEAQGPWAGRSLDERVEALQGWRAQLARQADELARAMVLDVRKPWRDARDEIDRALALLDTGLQMSMHHPAPQAPGMRTRHMPWGVVGAITPWNNPVALAVGKIGPALVHGNAVLWKPSPWAPACSDLLMQTLADSPVPTALVQHLPGDSGMARQILRAPRVSAITLTGSHGAGVTAQALCSLHGKALQAELGGNNAVVVLADADLPACIDALLLSAFSYSGQRCTAIRRFVVEAPLAAAFRAIVPEAMQRLRLGPPESADTVVAPLVRPAHAARVRQAVTHALTQGCQLLAQTDVPASLLHDDPAWVGPCVLEAPDHSVDIVQQETFGPVAVLQVARDLPNALELANAVPQGLVAGLVTDQADAVDAFLREARAGLIKLGAGPVPVHPHAPFGGWKASGLGLPEHGLWDAHFFSRPQAVYGSLLPQVHHPESTR